MLAFLRRSVLAVITALLASTVVMPSPATALSGVGDLVTVGGIPLHAALSPKGQYLVTADTYGHSMTFVKVSSNQVVDTLDLGDFGPETVEFFRNGKTIAAYGNEGGDYKVKLVSMKTHTVTLSFTVDSDTLACTLNPANTQILCPTATGLNLYSYSTTTGDLSTMYPLGTSGEGIYFDKKGTTAFVIDGGSNAVVAFNLKTYATTSIPVDDYPTWSAMSPNHKLLYVPDDNNADLRVINTKSKSVVDTITFPGLCGAASATVSPDGKRLYVPCHSSGILYAVDTKSNEIVESESIEIMAGICDVDILPNGRFGYVTIDEQNAVGKLRFP